MNAYILRHNKLWILTWTNPDGRICTEKMGQTVTKKEYIETLSVEQLRELLDTFTKILIDQDELNYFGEDEEDEEVGFFCPNSGSSYIE
jgi:uncharacterized protein YggL (DUF469 family)